MPLLFLALCLAGNHPEPTRANLETAPHVVTPAPAVVSPLASSNPIVVTAAQQEASPFACSPYAEAKRRGQCSDTSLQRRIEDNESVAPVFVSESTPSPVRWDRSRVPSPGPRHRVARQHLVRR